MTVEAPAPTRDLFDNPSLTLTRETTAADVEDWDSLNHVNLIVAIEKTFKIRFTALDNRDSRRRGHGHISNC